MQKISVLITGASSGIGAALALLYSKQNANLFLTARNAENLNKIANLCKENASTVIARVVDSSNASEMLNFITESHKISPLNLVIANAGIASNTLGLENPNQIDSITKITSVNINGVLNTVLPAIDLFKAQGYGQIALVSSATAFFGMKSVAPYAASKAWVKSFGESLRLDLEPLNIKVSVIIPGFVQSNITKTNNFSMPFLITSDKAAKIIAKGLSKNKALIFFPLPIKLIVLFLNMLPVSFRHAILKKLPNK